MRYVYRMLWKVIVENCVEVVENCGTAGGSAAGPQEGCYNFVTFQGQKYH